MTLKELFELQGALNRLVGFDADAIADSLASDDETGSTDTVLLTICGEWLDNFLKGMSSELEELRSCTYWKHWCSEAQRGDRYMLHNLEGARKEVIDLLHFWVSLAQAVGMTPAMVEEMYRTKLQKNVQRQHDGYSVELKAKAWAMFSRSKLMCPILQPGDIGAKSFEDLSEKVQRYYLHFAGVEDR